MARRYSQCPKTAKHLTCLLFIASYFSYTESARYELIQPENASCACLGDVLTYTCTAVGGGNTQWGGDAFDCSETSNEIILSHTFYVGTGTHGACNNGAITGRSLGIFNENCYTSQLNITVQKISSTVECIHNAQSGPMLINESSITAVTGPYPPPGNLRITDIQSGHVTFTWDPASPSCSSIHYNITSDCGVCPVTTNSTNITCSDQQIPSICRLSVQSIICGFTGSSSVPVEQTLKFSDVPNVERIIPHYLQSNRELVRVTIKIARNISDDLLNVTQYCISSPDSRFFKYSSCTGVVCEYIADLSLLLNQCRSNISINISAVNALGAGPPLQHTISGCNSFITVEYDNEEAIFSCIFNDKADAVNKSCSISYGSCGNLSRKDQLDAQSTDSSPDRVLLELSPKPSTNHPSLCYNITATSGMQTVIVEGHIDSNINSDSSRRQRIIIAAVTVPVSASIILFVVGLLVWWRAAAKRNYCSSRQENIQQPIVKNTCVDEHAATGEEKEGFPGNKGTCNT